MNEHTTTIDLEKFQRLIAGLRDVVYSVDVDTKRFSYLSQVFETMFGYTFDDVQRMGGRQEFLRQVIQEGKFIEQEQVLEDLKSGKTVKQYRHVAWWRCQDGALKCIEDHWAQVYEKQRLVSTDGVLRDITEQKKIELEHKRLIGELQEALAKIKTLRGLIPICASCKKIRDDAGFWEQVEVYVRKNSEAEFSHGLCPDCVPKYFPRSEHPS